MTSTPTAEPLNEISQAPAAQPARLSDRIREFCESRFGLDLRSLALFRMGLAILILGDLFIRAQDLRMFYTDWGVLPRSVYLERFADPWIVSLHLMSGRAAIQAILFLMAAVFAVMLFFGYRTRFATIASWVMLISLQSRNPMVLQGGDGLFRLLLFWAMFLPLGAKYSVDAGLNSSDRKLPERVFNAGTVGLMAQVAILYWFSVLWKSGPEWRSEFTAVWYALSLEQFSSPLGQYMLNFPQLLKGFTIATLAIELLAPLMLFIPFKYGPIRTGSVLFLIGLQLGFSAHLNLGPFPYVASTMMIAMLPTWFWQRVPRRLPPLQAVYFDQTCPFCIKLTRILKAMFLQEETPLLPAQSSPQTKQTMDREHSWIVIDASGRQLYRIEALAAALSQRRWMRPIVAVMLWKPVFETLEDLYEWVADHRPLMSRWVEFLQFRPLRVQLSTAGNVIASIALLWIIAWNFDGLRDSKLLPYELRIVPVVLRLDQEWGMFSPGPLRDDGWYLIKGTLRDDRQVDLWRDGEPIDMRRRTPREVANQYPTERWRKYFTNLYLGHHAAHRLYYGRYLCRSWNESHTGKDQVVSFQIYFYLRTNQPPGTPPKEHEPRMIHEHYCFK